MLNPVRSTPFAPGRLASWQEKRVADYVEDHIGSSIRASDLARVACLSDSHFSRTFRRTFGMTTVAYIAKRRVLHSQRLMLGTSEPLCRIALECGLTDQSHFTKVFRRIVGVAPALWRRQFACDPPHRLSRALASSMESLP